MYRFASLATIALLTSICSFAQEQTEPEVLPEYVAETAAIIANRRVQSAMEHILAIEPQSRRDLVELTEIPAPPFEEQARAERFAEMLREAGLSDVIIDEVGNAINMDPPVSPSRR